MPGTLVAAAQWLVKMIWRDVKYIMVFAFAHKATHNFFIRSAWIYNVICDWKRWVWTINCRPLSARAHTHTHSVALFVTLSLYLSIYQSVTITLYRRYNQPVIFPLPFRHHVRQDTGWGSLPASCTDSQVAALSHVWLHLAHDLTPPFVTRHSKRITWLTWTDSRRNCLWATRGGKKIYVDVCEAAFLDFCECERMVGRVSG